MNKTPKTLKEKLAGLPPAFNITPIMDEHNRVKRKYLMYYEEAIDAWTIAPEEVELLTGHPDLMSVGDEIEIRFRLVEMTDAEFEALPVD